jgi:hypothetical protein
MVAIYPSAIKKFAYRQDFTNIVDAADVNVLYDEVTSIENTLGANPSWDSIDGKTVKWPNVSNRITAVREGTTIPYVNAQAHNVVVPYNGSLTMNWTSITWDTHSMFTGGSNLTCPRTGVYRFEIYIRWHADNLPNDSQQPAFNRSGALGIKCLPAGANFEIVDQIGYFPQGWQRANHQSASITMPWTQGQSVNMVAYQNTLTTGITATAMMSITFQRIQPTTNNM